MENTYTNHSDHQNGNGNGKYALPSFPKKLQAELMLMSMPQEDDFSLRNFGRTIRRRWLIIIGVSATLITIFIAITLNQKSEYEGNFRLLVEAVSNDNQLPDSTSVVQTNSAKTGLDYETQIQVLKSPEIMTSIVKQLKVDYPEISYASLVNSLSIARLGETKIIEVRYRTEKPENIKKILSTIASTYLNYSLEKRQTKLHQGIQFVNKQLPTIKNRVDSLEKELQLFRQKYNFNEPKTQAEEIANQVAILSQQRLALNQEIAKAHYYFNSLQTTDGKLTALTDAPQYQQLIGQVRQLDTQMAFDSTVLQDQNPSMQILAEKRQNLLPILRREAQRVLGLRFSEAVTRIQNLEAQNQQLNHSEQELRQEFKLLPVLERKYTELERELSIANDSLNRFLSTRENLQINIAQTELPWQLIQPPGQIESPISPSIQRNLLLGLVGSTLLGICAGLLAEKCDNTFHTVDALKERIKVPLLGTVPFDKQILNSRYNTPKERLLINSQLVKIDNHQNHPEQNQPEQNNGKYESLQFLEAIRVIHTNLQLLSSDEPINSLVITSALPGDGKSTVAFYLAQVAAAMGKKVLLVDADMRRPQVHALSNLNNLWGLSSLITGNCELEQVIQEFPSISDFSIITAGPIPPDPTKLLSSVKMQRLMKDFEHSFDLVIYDTPPVTGLADASLIAPYTSGVAIVVRMNKTDQEALKEGLDSLKISRTNVLGIIGNGHKGNLSTYYKYY